MENLIIIACYVAVLAIVVGCLSVKDRYFERKRCKKWEAVASRHGFTYSRHDPYDIPKRFASFFLFQVGVRLGKAHATSHCLKGNFKGTPVLMFEYCYTTGKTSSTQTAVIAPVNIAHLILMIRPKTWLGRIFKFFGSSNDNEFESKEFNRRFDVTCSDRKVACDICHSGMMDYLLQVNRHAHLEWEVSEGHLILYGAGTFDSDKIEYCLNAMNGFLSRIPSYLRKG